MPVDWQPTVEEITPHLHRWTEGSPTAEQTAALEAFAAEAVADVQAEVSITIPTDYEPMAQVAARYLAAYRYVRSWHPEEDDLLRERFHDDYVEALDRLKRVVHQTSPDVGRRRYGSPRLGNDFIS